MELIQRFVTNNPCWKNNLNAKYLYDRDLDKRYWLFQQCGPQGGMLHSVGCAQPSALVFIDYHWNKESQDKPVRYTDPPGEAPSGYQWSEIWSEDDGNIQQGWVLVEVPITDEDALVRYANELTGEQDETLTEATEALIKKLKED